MSSLARTDYPEAHLVYTRSNFPRNLKLHQKGGGGRDEKSHESGAGLSLSFMTCVPQQRQAVRIPEGDGWDTEGEGKVASRTPQKKEKVACVPHFWVQVLETCFCLNNIKYRIFPLRDSVVVCFFGFSGAYDLGQRSSSMFSRSILP